MNGRECITNILRGRMTDRLAWTTLIDEPSRSSMDESVRNLHPFDFYRMVGCDIMQFGDHGFYGTPQEVGLPCCLAEPDIETQAVINTDGAEEITRNTVLGNLKTILADAHPMKYPVETIGDLR